MAMSLPYCDNHSQASSVTIPTQGKAQAQAQAQAQAPRQSQAAPLESRVPIPADKALQVSKHPTTQQPGGLSSFLQPMSSCYFRLSIQAMEFRSPG